MPKPRARRETSAGGVVFSRGPDGPVFLLILDGHGNWGFPKGHIEPGEQAVDAARREIGEETGAQDLQLRGELDRIDWYFRVGRSVIHKFCHLFLFEAPHCPLTPQREEGIAECSWYRMDEALRALAYENSRAVLRKAGVLVQSLAQAAEAVTQDG